MRFELDKALMDDILFYMENQDGDFLLDIQEGCVVDINNHDFDDEPDFEDNERFISIPNWDSGNGYRLMEKFAVSLKNKEIREKLSSALNRNKGVFRAFRDTLDQYPEIEKLWFIFKEQKMKEEVIVWYNALREEWGLEPIGMEPEDNTSLVLEDFCFNDEKSDSSSGKFIITAETADGGNAGTIKAAIVNMVLHIETLEVKPEYRGMGIGKTLLAKIIEKAEEENLDVTIDLPEETDFFKRSLLLENFEPVTQKFIRRK
ncbi:MAG: GNAT family N-acetyltransferase [Treponema sp.]|nr:GNAT family N-acetyltransferase [Treponema sp.]